MKVSNHLLAITFMIFLRIKSLKNFRKMHSNRVLGVFSSTYSFLLLLLLVIS